MMGLKHNLENLLDQKSKVEPYQSVELDKSHPFHFQCFRHSLTDNSHSG